METENCDVDLAEETEKSDDENKHGGHEEEADDLVSIEPCKCSQEENGDDGADQQGAGCHQDD
jgi:hypothetical protein